MLVMVAATSPDTARLLKTQLIGSLNDKNQPQVAEWLRPFRALVADTQRSHLEGSNLAAEMARLLDANSPSVKKSITIKHTTPDLADEAEHDRYFRIERVDAPVAWQAVRSILEAKVRFHQSMLSSYDALDQASYDGIGLALAATLAFLAGERPARMTKPDRPAPGRSSEAPAVRWVTGHQIFAALTQCLIIAMQCFERELLVGDTDAAGEALDLAATLLLASASAFRFTADFSADAYRDRIRPSMAPDQVGRGFSGLLSEDHRYLVEVMTRTRPLMAEAAAVLPTQHRRVSDALAYVYEDHQFVCARFGGDAGSSLRSDACSEVPGTVLLQRFKRARTRLLVPMGPSA